jgi:hypothetical protein
MMLHFANETSVRSCHSRSYLIRLMKLDSKTMRWNSSNLMTGMQSLLGNFMSQSSSRAETSIESIRQAMLDTLGASGASRFPVVQLRVSYANEIQDLWYLRGDLMAVLSTIEGEATARTKLANISDMFRGLLPKGMTSRPSPLGS